MSRERFAGRPLALERLHGLCPRRRLLGRQFILGRSRFQLFELKLHLLQQPRLTLRARAVKCPPQLLDLELGGGVRTRARFSEKFDPRVVMGEHVRGKVATNRELTIAIRYVRTST